MSERGLSWALTTQSNSVFQKQIQLALRNVRAFLKANRPPSVAHQPLAAAAQ
jgi:hypothetical protein